MPFITIHGGNMVEIWMPITANILLILMGLIFTIGGANAPSRFIGVICIVVAVLSLLANTGVIN
jgi:hypothetical protein